MFNELGNEMNLLISKKAAEAFGINRRIVVASVGEASAVWSEMRDKSCMGVSEIGNGGNVLNDSGKRVAKVSYNGRVWE